MEPHALEGGIPGLPRRGLGWGETSLSSSSLSSHPFPPPPPPPPPSSPSPILSSYFQVLPIRPSSS
eukprot:4104674-Pyramimonas_sp.AAC.1